MEKKEKRKLNSNAMSHENENKSKSMKRQFNNAIGKTFATKNGPL
jgi:hypothetical protein